MRKLIDGCRRESIARVQASNEHRPEQHRTVTMHSRISEISGDCVLSALRLNFSDRAPDLVKRLRPTDALPAAARSSDRISQTVRVRVNILQRHRFRTDISATERIILISADVESSVVAYYKLNNAHRFA